MMTLIAAAGESGAANVDRHFLFQILDRIRGIPNTLQKVGFLALRGTRPERAGTNCLRRTIWEQSERAAGRSSASPRRADCRSATIATCAFGAWLIFACIAHADPEPDW